MKTTYAPFDAADYLDNDDVIYLDNDDVIAEYLSAAIEAPNPDVFLAALGDVAKARGMAQMPKMPGSDVRIFTRLWASLRIPATKPSMLCCGHSE